MRVHVMVRELWSICHPPQALSEQRPQAMILCFTDLFVPLRATTDIVPRVHVSTARLCLRQALQALVLPVAARAIWLDSVAFPATLAIVQPNLAVAQAPVPPTNHPLIPILQAIRSPG